MVFLVALQQSDAVDRHFPVVERLPLQRSEVGFQQVQRMAQLLGDQFEFRVQASPPRQGVIRVAAGGHRER